MINHPLTVMLPMILAMSTITALVMQRRHLLMALLALEGMILSLLLMLGIYMAAVSPNDAMLTLVMLSLGACEASLGLAVLIALTRKTGNDMCNLQMSVKL